MAFDTYTIRTLIKEHGVVSTLRVRSTGSYNASTGVVANSATDYAVMAYSYSTVPSELSSGSISGGYRMYAISNLTTTGTVIPKPDVTDQMISNKTGDIIKVMEITSSNSVSCYLLTVKE